MGKCSLIKGFYNLSINERHEMIRSFSDLSSEDINMLNNPDALTLERADLMVENMIGRIQIPMGIATNLIVNGKDYLVPMATEESSVIAAASNASKLIRSKGGVIASNSGAFMIAQMQILGIDNPYSVKAILMEHKKEIIELANEQDAVLVSFGGGAKDIEVRVIDSKIGPMVILHLIVDTKDAMGANAVNTMVEALAPMIETISGGKVYLKILSNLADKRIVRARAIATKKALGGEDVVDAIICAGEFANIDPYRAATHNKGIMNGISAVVLATGNDTRAVEAGAHAYASRNGIYTSLTKWEKTTDGDLAGSIELPIAVGLVGGATATHPTSKLAVKILGVESALELAEVIASIGLVQNLAAIKALATEGIQRGHMSLHARNIAINAGAKDEFVDKVANKMIAMKKVRVDIAKEIIKDLSSKS